MSDDDIVDMKEAQAVVDSLQGQDFPELANEEEATDAKEDVATNEAPKEAEDSVKK